MTSEIYIFLDESGDFDFTANGTKHFCFSALCTTRPFAFYHDFSELRYDLISSGNITRSTNNLEYFHCSEDSPETKRRVFEVICQHKSKFEVLSIAIQKNRIKEEFREFKKFYPSVLGNFISNIVSYHLKAGYLNTQLVFIIDQIPEKNKRKSIEKSLKIPLAALTKLGATYKIIHHQSKSHIGLQVVDYINWAVYQKVKNQSKGKGCAYFDKISDIISLRILDENDLPN